METFLTAAGEALVMVAATVLLTRLAGLRSLSKMSGFDFAVTIATGSVIASVVAGQSTGLGVGLSALVGLFAVQVLFGRLRQRFKPVQDGMDNTPLLLVHRGEVLEGNLASARITYEDMLSKLRLAGVSRVSEVQAMVLETTGDVSVITGDAPEEQLLAPVRGGPRRPIIG